MLPGDHVIRTDHKSPGQIVLEMQDIIDAYKDNHPSNGWFPQRLKAYVTGQRLKALAFTMFKPIAFVTFAAP